MSSSSTRILNATNPDFKYKNTCLDFPAFSYPFLSTKHKNTNRSPARTQTQSQQQIQTDDGERQSKQ